MNNPKTPTPERVMQLAWGYAPTLIVSAAVRHGVFEKLGNAPQSLEELARATGTTGRGLGAILNALVGLNLLQRDGERYGLTPESEAFLVPGRPDYRGTFFHHHVDQLLPQWMQLEEVVRTGQPAARTNRERAGGEYFAAFVESLFSGGYPAARLLARHLKLQEAVEPVKVLDLGAGSGVWGITLAEHSPRVQVTAVDWPPVLEVTCRVAQRHGVADRVECVAGDLFTCDYGTGYQVAVLGHILHSEGPERIRELLARAHRALAPEGVIVIQEFVPNDDRRGPLMPLIFAVNMLVNTDLGGTYTFAEISEWLAGAGFRNARKLPAPAVSPLILADKA